MVVSSNLWAEGTDWPVPTLSNAPCLDICPKEESRRTPLLVPCRRSRSLALNATAKVSGVHVIGVERRV